VANLDTTFENGEEDLSESHDAHSACYGCAEELFGIPTHLSRWMSKDKMGFREAATLLESGRPFVCSVSDLSYSFFAGDSSPGAGHLIRWKSAEKTGL
jgi:hypothetical protein